MNFAIKILRTTCWLSMFLMLFHGLTSPIFEPVHLKMNNLPEMAVNPWFITPPALFSALGCKFLLDKNIFGYPLIVFSSVIGFVISPMPYPTLLPIVLISIPFFFTVYHASKKI